MKAARKGMVVAAGMALVLGWASPASAEPVAVAIPSASKSWLSKTFGSKPWSEVTRAYDTPREICRVIERNIRYVNDKADQWSYPEETWNRGKGDCEDIAICIQTLCEMSGLPASVHLYFPAGAGKEGHAVLVGEWNGKTWFSSNGSYEEAASEQDVKRRVARMLSCKEKELWVMKLSQRDVLAYLEKTPARAVAGAAR